MKNRLLALYVIGAFLCRGGLLLAMDAEQNRQAQAKRAERARFARTNQEIMLQAFDAGKMSQVFDCLSSGASVDALIIHAFARDHDLNQADLNGRTFLHYAVLFGTQQTIEKLVSNGANPFVVDNTGQSPMGLLSSRLENAKKNSDTKKQEVLACINKHTDMCNKLSARINADKTKSLAEKEAGMATSKVARLENLKNGIETIKALEEELQNAPAAKAALEKSLRDGTVTQEQFDKQFPGIMTQERFDRLRKVFPEDFDTARKDIEQNFDHIFATELADYAKDRDKVRDNMLKTSNAKHAKELAKLRADEARFDQKIADSQRRLALFTNALETRPEFRNSVLENHLKGNPSDLASFFQSSIDHMDFIKKIKKACPIITALSATIVIRYVYISLAAASQLSSLKNQLFKTKTALLNIDFDIHNAESVFKPIEEMCDVELFAQDEEKQAALEAALTRFDELVLALCDRIKAKYFYHPASYFVEQESVLVNELEQVYSMITTILDEGQRGVSIKKSMKILMGSALLGTVTCAYALYANPLKKWGLFS
jgi:hypothetical protein